MINQRGDFLVEEADRRRQILDAAFEEFSAKGFKGATIKSIAEVAGLQSPAVIYWYFPDKEALFREVLGTKMLVVQAVTEPGRLMELPPEEVLPTIGRRYLATFDDPAAQRMVRLMVGEAMRRPEIAEIFGNAVMKRVLGFLKRYMARQIQRPRLYRDAPPPGRRQVVLPCHKGGRADRRRARRERHQDIPGRAPDRGIGGRMQAERLKERHGARHNVRNVKR